MRNKREKVYLTVALLAMVILAGDRLVWGPLNKNWEARDTKIGELEKKVHEGNKLLLASGLTLDLPRSTPNKWLARAVTSITESGGTATIITTAPHPFETGDPVYLSGAEQEAYNTLHANITKTSKDSFTFSIGGNPGNATGPILVRRGDKEEWRTFLSANLNSTDSIAQADVLRAIENWTDDSDISVQLDKGEWRNHEDRYQTYDVRLVAEGTMQEAVEFVHAIESDKLPLKIEQLELASREKTGKLISVSVHFTGLQLGEALQ